MPRYKKYDYSQSMLLPVEFSKQIIPGAMEYVINYMVEKKLNLKSIDKIDGFLKTTEPKNKTRHGERQSNITDNESAKMQTPHGVIQGYNGNNYGINR